MPKKNRGRTIYNEIYDDVEKLAHLPENLDGVDKEKAFRLVAKLNHGIFFEARKRSLKNLTNYDQRDRFSYLILHAIMDNCPNMNKLMGDFSNELNEARGTRKENNKFIISSSKYYDLDHYDRERFDNIVGIMDGVRELNDKIAQDMYDAVMAEAGSADVIIKAAAVADYRPASVSDNKIKKKDGDMSIALERTTDILKTLGENKKPGQFLCGFSMETENMIENSKAKLAKKNLDMIAANNVKVDGAGFGVDTNILTLITADSEKELPIMSKDEAADALLDEILVRK